MQKRTFLKLIGWLGATFWIGRFWVFGGSTKVNAAQQGEGGTVKQQSSAGNKSASQKYNLGVDEDGKSRIYLGQGGSAEENMRKTLALMGGIGSLIGPDDIVVLKPNAQWWNQGMTNTDAMKAFIEEVLDLPGFRGEVIIAENHQYAQPNSRGWVTDKRNGAFNYNELVEYFNSRGAPQVTKYHWRCAGPNPHPLEGDAANESKVVSGPGEGDGYVWRDDLVYHSPLGRKCMMTYPVFTSAYSGVTIDLKNGAWKDGQYTGQPVRFINFSVVNHHGPYCGVTASIKNFMGVVDMTCGFQGSIPEGYHNTHFIGLRQLKLPYQKHLHWRIQHAVNNYNWKYFSHTGAVLGMFMREIRKADLNIITAHWTGWGGRTKPELSGYPKAILASRDPVAIDYVATQEILQPLTRSNTDNNKLLNLNNAALKSGPFHRFLADCHAEGIGNLSPQNHLVITG